MPQPDGFVVNTRNTSAMLIINGIKYFGIGDSTKAMFFKMDGDTASGERLPTQYTKITGNGITAAIKDSTIELADFIKSLNGGTLPNLPAGTQGNWSKDFPAIPIVVQ